MDSQIPFIKNRNRPEPGFTFPGILKGKLQNERLKNGIPLMEAVVEDLKILLQKNSVYPL